MINGCLLHELPIAVAGDLKPILPHQKRYCLMRPERT